ncbi:hypothetical protein ACFL35_13925 [Candidatus Riflebacteria bacterium]
MRTFICYPFPMQHYLALVCLLLLMHSPLFAKKYSFSEFFNLEFSKPIPSYSGPSDFHQPGKILAELKDREKKAWEPLKKELDAFSEEKALALKINSNFNPLEDTAPYREIRAFARFMALNSLHNIKNGRAEIGLSGLKAIIVIAGKLAMTRNIPLLAQMIGLALYGIVSQAAMGSLIDSEFFNRDSAEGKKILNILSNWPEIPYFLEKMADNELNFGKTLKKKYLDGKGMFPISRDVLEHGIKELEWFYKILKTVLRQKNAQKTIKAMSIFERSVNSKAGIFFTSILPKYAVPNMMRASSQYWSKIAKGRAIRILARWKKGERNLETLATNDPFSADGKSPLIIKVEGSKLQKIYSVFRNAIDDGGIKDKDLILFPEKKR